MRQYIPIKVVGAWAGVFGSIDILQGVINAGDFFSSARDNPTWARESDQGGSGTRVKNSNKGGNLSITFSASDPINNTLSNLVETDEVAENIVGVINLKDLSGETVIVATGAFIPMVPDPSFGSERGSRTWTWECEKIVTHLGGHNLV